MTARGIAPTHVQLPDGMLVALEEDEDPAAAAQRAEAGYGAPVHLVAMIPCPDGDEASCEHGGSHVVAVED